MKLNIINIVTHLSIFSIVEIVSPLV